MFRAAASLSVNNHELTEGTKQYLTAAVTGLDVMVRIYVLYFCCNSFVAVIVCVCDVVHRCSDIAQLVERCVWHAGLLQ